MIVLRNISFILLACVYLTISSGTILATIAPMSVGVGPAVFDVQRGPVKEMLKKVIVARRHLSLVKPCCSPFETTHPNPAEVNTEGEHALFELRASLPYFLEYHTSLSGRAPPRT